MGLKGGEVGADNPPPVLESEFRMAVSTTSQIRTRKTWHLQSSPKLICSKYWIQVKTEHSSGKWGESLSQDDSQLLINKQLPNSEIISGQTHKEM